MFGTESLAQGGTVAPSTTRHFADFRDDWFVLALPRPPTSLEELFQAMAVPSDALPAIEFNPLRPRGSNTVAFRTVHGSTRLALLDIRDLPGYAELVATRRRPGQPGPIERELPFVATVAATLFDVIIPLGRFWQAFGRL